jgi:hypothetical protein
MLVEASVATHAAGAEVARSATYICRAAARESARRASVSAISDECWSLRSGALGRAPPPASHPKSSGNHRWCTRTKGADEFYSPQARRATGVLIGRLDLARPSSGGHKT